MPDINLSLELLGLLFLTGLAAGTIDAIAGGGGLIALPALLATGLPPAHALATNKLQGSFGTFSSSLYFIRQQLVRPREIRRWILFTFVGSALGTLLVQLIDPGFLSTLIPVLLILIALYFALGPRLKRKRQPKPCNPRLFDTGVCGGCGFYDGFFGPGTGSFFALGFVELQGFDLTRATAHTKVLNLTSNIASLGVFILGGKVVWSLGLAMAVGQLLGGRLGAHLVVLKGSRLIRPLIVIMTLAISLKLLLQ